MVIALSIFFGSKPLTIFHLHICRWLAWEISFISFFRNFWAITTTSENSQFRDRVCQGYRSLISECISEVYANTWESWATRNWHSTPSLVRFIKQFLQQLAVFTAVTKRGCHSLEFPLLFSYLVIISLDQGIYLDLKKGFSQKTII